MTTAKRPKVDERELRAMLARKARALSNAIVSKHCRHFFALQAQSYQWLYSQVEALAALKRKRSPEYREFCQWLLMQFAESGLGHLADIPQDTLPTLEKLCDILIAVMSGKTSPQMSGPEFVNLSKRLFVPKKKSGPHPLSKYDRAFVRRTNGEKLSDIIKDLEPEAMFATPMQLHRSIPPPSV